ncbi:sensor histidine kinase [Gracilibacillus boraciitolerans]|uniref:sensor histidine kinase n=1 Tax=Gracilibacillus boraciitolerans TaxID=307521 RepID=UPI0005533DD3|nr:HAMP domain-containing sensor histidine kinase [Gracilibacillus boraciitolerans]
MALDSIIQTVIRRMKPAFDNKNISIDVNCPENSNVFIDTAPMQQVFINLLDNAHKHSDQITSICLKVTEHKSTLEIVIQDEGEGIPKEELSGEYASGCIFINIITNPSCVKIENIL